MIASAGSFYLLIQISFTGEKHMNKASVKQRIEYFDYLRILATLSVIMIHVCTPYWFSTDVFSSDWLYLNLYESISRWSVPIFFMISGTLFLSSTQGIRQILRKNICHMVTAFLFWSTIYIGICYFKGQYSLPDALREILFGYYHMWYLYVITGLYLAVPILRQLTKSRETTRYFLLMALLFNTILPYAAIYLGLFDLTLQQTAERMMNSLSFQMVCGYSLYFVLGWYLHNTDITPKNRKVIYVLGIVSLLATVVMSYTESIRQQTPVHTFFEYLSPNVFFVSAAAFVFAKYHFRYGKLPATAVTLLQTLSKYSFGVYLVHALLYDTLRYNLNFDLLAYPPVISIPAVSLALLAASFLVSALLHQIPVLKKHIV